MNKSEVIRSKILNQVKKFYDTKFIKQSFVPGKSKINYAGRVFDSRELIVLVDSCLDFWLTEGRYSEQFTEKIADYLNAQNVILSNSGSSSNLLAISALTSEKLGDRKLNPGDEVLTVAGGFPSTISPIIQNGLIPVFVDLDPETLNINVDIAEKAISKKTKCVFLAHTLGNPFDLEKIIEICNKNNLWLIEDNCDAFGSRYKGKLTGTFGNIATISFYPAHHITTGEGGAVVTNDNQLAQIIRSFRDWGRDCYCSGGENNTCGKRFSQGFGDLPLGYDHKYVYTEVGYNLKMTDMQAAIGSAQMDKLEYFCKSRKENFKKLYAIFSKYSQFFILPKATSGSDPAWFAFFITLKSNAPFSRNQITGYLNDRLIETRNLFAGNIIRQPGYKNKNFRIYGDLDITDNVMNNTFFLGTYPGLSEEMLVYLEETLSIFLSKF